MNVISYVPLVEKGTSDSLRFATCADRYVEASLLLGFVFCTGAWVVCNLLASTVERVTNTDTESKVMNYSH